ncbi:MAG: RNA 3'-terminal phosphate cyclase [Alphaproteobacteria bacterium]
MTRPLVIDGSHGEGGGQILRTSLALSALSGRTVRFVGIRAGRPKPGLAAQHLTAVRAAAALCSASLDGDTLGSTELTFAPKRAVRTGSYDFDVAEAREGGSAGAVTLVLQTVLLPLAFAEGASTLTIHGGTHVPWSPSADFIHDVWLPTLDHMGLSARFVLIRSGWYPAGGGAIQVHVAGSARLAALNCESRGKPRVVRGRAIAANLPSHIPQRMADRARALLDAAGIRSAITPERLTASSPGAGLFLTAEYDHALAGFSAMGRPGKPSEQVADEAVDSVLAHRDSGAAIDAHLGDQLILPAALATGSSRFSVERITRHILTNAWVVELFGRARVAIDGAEGLPGTVEVAPVA